jgi:hypothetical protein
MLSINAELYSGKKSMKPIVKYVQLPKGISTKTKFVYDSSNMFNWSQIGSPKGLIFQQQISFLLHRTAHIRMNKINVLQYFFDGCVYFFQEK